MTTKKLIAYLQTFPPDAKVQLWRWTERGGLIGDCAVAANEEHQREQNCVTLTANMDTWEPE